MVDSMSSDLCMLCFLQEEELKKAILVVFANKQDMEQAMTPTEVANSLGLPALKDRKWQIFKTSATKGTGLDEAMEWCVLTRCRGGSRAKNISVVDSDRCYMEGDCFFFYIYLFG